MLKDEDYGSLVLHQPLIDLISKINVHVYEYTSYLTESYIIVLNLARQKTFLTRPLVFV